MSKCRFSDANNRNNHDHTRRSFASVFLLLMLLQIGSHVAIDAHGQGGFEHHVNVFQLESGHHDYDHHECDCRSAVDCTVDLEHEDQLPILQDENNHHHAFAAASLFRFLHNGRSSQRLEFAQAILDTRRQAPPFLPPKHS